MVKLSRKAEIAMHSMFAADRAKIQRGVRQLERLPGDLSVMEKAKKIHGAGDDLYLMRASPKLRIIFRFDGEKAEVVDVVTRDRLKRMHQYLHENA